MLLAIFALFYFLFDCHYFIRTVFVVGINHLRNVCFGITSGEITEESVQNGRTFHGLLQGWSLFRHIEKGTEKEAPNWIFLSTNYSNTLSMG